MNFLTLEKNKGSVGFILLIQHTVDIVHKKTKKNIALI